ncbi:hypothetical protein CLV58_101166 [Spirosoma oryzae]|uniref:Uncharacterized protein n=1 Tax=Spirosoma oryzae TaxID=1469603 RepID=A0A2T0TMZ8_9BACT|nr:hypothetical protein CLV58_101166 [Spirosoma oryzae]
MAKKITVIHSAENLIFSIGDREVKLSESMPIKDAELIDAQYPGLYLKITEDTATTTPATTEPTKTK